MAESEMNVRMAFTPNKDNVCLIITKADNQAITSRELLDSVREFLEGIESVENNIEIKKQLKKVSKNG